MKLLKVPNEGCCFFRFNCFEVTLTIARTAKKKIERIFFQLVDN